MNHTSSYETVKNAQKSKEKSYQELYDKYIRKGDEAIIAEDIISAEKYYQHADHYLRLMNDPGLSENASQIQPLTPSHPIEELIAKALMGIKVERARRKEALLKQVREVAGVAKAAREKRKVANAAYQEQNAQGKMAGSKKKADKKATGDCRCEERSDAAIQEPQGKP